MTVYGYARVSTTEQNTAVQLAAFKRAGIKHVVQEKRSGVARRPELQALLSKLRPGDVLVVYKLDRLSRSLRDLLRLLESLEQSSVAFRSLTESIDTSTPAGRMFCHMLGAFAEFERAMIRERCAAGFEAAKARGQKFGRARAMPEKTEAKLVRMYLSGNYTMQALADHFDVHTSSVKRAIYRVTKPDHSSLR
ncbi:recombinase family protein [Acidovorax sp. ACV02]|uniref:recombinase family protein n=1 Tax=Acidovorax sp. ACV02 TaxID=2769310 RepID=UPI00177AEA1E|nr:recombinase family protein [Acidovorax sp. ACV02]MBD9403857.1 recombinase family protein [Acidovorax sp. ACV02]